MKILITGCTAMQVDSPRKQNHLISNLESIKRCLESLGHEVTWQDVDVGEDLSSYDRVFISWAPLSSWGTRYMGGCLWAYMTHPHVIFTADDWQVRGIHQSALGLWKRMDYFDKTIWSHWQKILEERPADLALIKHVMRQGVRALAYPSWPVKMLVPCWEGGRLSDLRLPADQLVAYDPSPFMGRYHYPAFQEKCHRWIFASLTAKDGWLEKHRFAWPVMKYGNVRQGQHKVPEDELAVIYAGSWGVISPPHNVSSAGWFRVRFQMAADAGCIMFCGDDEARILGNGPYWVTPKLVEQMNDEGRQTIVEAQRAALAAKSWSKERMQDVISELIKD